MKLLRLCVFLLIVSCAPGHRGSQGVQGEQGLSCTVLQDERGATIECPDGSTAVILNGKDCKRGHR